MPILHMETELVRNTGQQLQQTADSLNQQLQNLRQSVGGLTSSSWQGPSSQAFQNKMDPLLAQMNRLVEAGSTLNQRLQREADEWEQVDSQFGVGVAAGIEGGYGIAEGSVSPPGGESGEEQSQYDVESQDFRLDADGLIDFRPDYAGDELGDVMQDMNAFIAANYKDGVCADNHELIQRMADALGIEYEAAQHQYSQLTKVLSESNLTKVDDLSGIYDLKGYWGSRRQLMFGKVVGDSLGLHPAFASLLSPSGGIIGPGDGVIPLGLDGNLGGVFDENAWDYHGATHDAAGFLYNNYEIGPGYEYIDSPLNQDFMDTSFPVSGQVSGFVFWAQKMGMSKTDIMDALAKASLGPGGSILF